MTFFQTTALLLTLAAGAAFINARWIKLPRTIGLMAISLVGSMIVLLAGSLGVIPIHVVSDFVGSIDFELLLLHAMLAYLLFAGALHVEIGDLKQERLAVVALSTIGILIATFISGTLFWWVANAFGVTLSFVNALLFGALISPTDPIAVLGIIKKVNAPKRIETKIAGESLFNDGVGVVVFLTILSVANGKSQPEFSTLSLLLFKEAAGGAFLGFILGWVVIHMLKAVDEYQVEILVTLALATGGYVLAEALHVSAPITMVVSGLLIGNRGREIAMSENTRERLDGFWELVDEVLNSVLFLLIGLELIVITLHPVLLLIGVFAIAVALLGRIVSVAIPINLIGLRKPFLRGTTLLLTWGGLRGGISIALALSLPVSNQRNLIVTATYVVVVFSILVQGLTFGPALRRFLKTDTLHPPNGL
jgi:CPA1 family monovalent cation:H+ antiporter